MDLERELKTGNKIYLMMQEDSSVMMVVEEKGSVYKTSPCSIPFEEFSNIYQVLGLNYIVYIKCNVVYTVELVANNKKVIATFNALNVFDALKKLEEGIALYFERRGNRIVRR